MYGLQYASWGKVLFYNLKDMEKRWVINPPLFNYINHKLIPNVSQKVVVSFIYIQRKDGVYFMSTKNYLH